MIGQDLPPLSQGLDYLGELNAKLRDLRGFDTLANELIQNADDAKATRIVFDIRDDCLIVENDAVFEDCGDVTLAECPWKSDKAKEHRCDFHRFRNVAGADKRNQADTTGAFGFGFVSVYQITNNPELISASHHWRLRPDYTEDSRIQRQTVNEFHDGTRFIFPWAQDPNCSLRNRLGCAAVTSQDVDNFAEKVAASAPQAILFLRNVLQIEIKINGSLSKVVERQREASSVTIKDGMASTRWHIFEGNFDGEAAALKKQYAGLIEAKRKAHVTVAIPADPDTASGLYYATLPTQHQTSLPIHINADFFPESNRKRLAFSAGYEGEWNEAAVRAAAVVLAGALVKLPDLLGYKGLWRLLSQVERVHRDALAGSIGRAATAFWVNMKAVAIRAPIVYTSTGKWLTPDKAHLLQNLEQEQPCLSILERLNVSVVHPELSEFRNLLTGMNVNIFSAFDLSDALANCGLDKAVMVDNAPDWLRDAEQHGLLATEIQLLLERVKGQNSALARKRMLECAVARSTDGWFTKPTVLRQAHPDLIILLEPLGLRRLFADPDNPPELQRMTSEFSALDIVTVLEQVPQSTFERLWAQNSDQFLDIIGLCADRRTEFQRDAELRARLSKARIWPADGKFYPLNELVVPGNFVDPFTFATVLDPRVVARCEDLLMKELNAPPLTIQHYAGVMIPRFFASGAAVDAQKCRRLIAELAEHIDALRDDNKVRFALAGCPLVSCQDGSLRVARETYFPTPEVADLMGPDAPTVFVPAEKAAQYKDFLDWLDVAYFPRPGDIMARIHDASLQASAPAAHRESVRRIFYELGRYWDRYTPEQRKEFAGLRALQWLPAKDNFARWYAPSEVCTVFQSHLFETTGLFLDVSRPHQTQAGNLIRFLEMKTEPTCQQVVTHIVRCSTEARDVNKEVYTFLNREGNVDDAAIRQLKNHACILLNSIGFVRPDQVFWRQHGFQPFLYTLAEDFHAYRSLFKVLDVRESPDATDAIKILCGIADGNQNKRLNDADYAVIMQCWTLITEAIQKEEVSSELLEPLRNRKVIPNKNRIIELPRHMFFEDRPNLAARFGELVETNVIERPLTAWLGMERAGVRPLSRAVDITLVSCDDVAPAEDLQRVLVGRRHLIERVIHPMRAEGGDAWNTHLLDRLKLQWCSRLEVGYTLRAFQREISSPPERADTFFDASDDTLYVLRGDAVPWRKIASGLAIVLNQDAEVGMVAPGLAVALSERTYAEGSDALDDLGIPPLQQRETFDTQASPSVGMGGIDAVNAEADGYGGPIHNEDENDEDAADDSDTFDPASHVADAPDERRADNTQNTSNGGKHTDINRNSPAPQNAGSAGHKPADSARQPASSASGAGGTSGEKNSGAGATPPAGSNGSAQTGSAGTSAPQSHPPRTPQPSTGQATRSGAQQQPSPPTQAANGQSAPSHASDARAEHGSRLRTYVFSGRDPDAPPSAQPRGIEAIDKAGIARVLVAEEQDGRDADEQPHNNPGYDIYALDADGAERYIEVKSLSGNWQTKGVMVSATQFNFAREKGPEFWLYVVERADKDDFQITRIQNPARQVGEFLFDDGWRNLGEQAGGHDTEE